MRERTLSPLVGRALSVFALVAMAMILGSPAAKAQQAQPNAARLADEDVMVLHVGKAQALTLPRAARDVLVSEPSIVETVMRTARRPVLFGMTIGQANVLFFDENGAQIRSIEIRVEYDTRMLDRMIAQHYPSAKIKAESVLGEVILTGAAQTSAQAAAIGGLAERFVAASRAAQKQNGESSQDDEQKGVVNRIEVLNEEQIHLKVRVAEVNRSVLKQLGVDWNAGLQATTLQTTLGFTGKTLQGFLRGYEIENLVSNGTPVDADGDGVQDFVFQRNQPLRVGPQALDSFFKALEEHTLVRTLAEPSLTAVSGEAASFLAGGEFPVPVGVGDLGISIEFKRFGVALDFTPVVIGDGRISLKVATEVSDLSDLGAITLEGFSIPALSVRRANTTVELSSGGTIMMAGLILQSTRRLSQGLPGLRNVPVIGQLFRSEEFFNAETELVILVTPYNVQQGAMEDFAMPTDGFAPSSDIDMYLFGRLYSVYGASEGAEAGAQARQSVSKLRAPVGFIME